MDVEDFLQKHAIQETEVNSIGDTIKKLNKQAQSLVLANYKESPLLDKKLEELNNEFKNLLEARDKRRALLEEARNFFSFLQNQEDEEAWIIEKQRICQATLIAKDLRAVLMLQQKHKVRDFNMARPVLIINQLFVNTGVGRRSESKEGENTEYLLRRRRFDKKQAPCC